MDSDDTIVGLDALDQLLLPDHEFPGRGGQHSMRHTQRDFKIKIEISGTHLNKSSKNTHFVSGDRVNGVSTLLVNKAATFDRIEVVLQGRKSLLGLHAFSTEKLTWDLL